VGFESSYRRHLDAEQRRAVLEAIGSSINPDSTLGEVVDAAEALGWNEQMGGLSLADLADALLAPEEDANQAAEADEVDEEQQDLDLDDEYEEEDEDEEPAPRARRAASKKAAKTPAKTPAAKKASTKRKAAKTPAAKKASRKKPSSKKSAVAKKASTKKSSKKGGRRKAEPVEQVEIDDRMSLDQAADFFVPYVEELGEATMQALEEETGIARRKLRFHVGQLVRNGYLERHGMGRGTYYTLA